MAPDYEVNKTRRRRGREDENLNFSEAEFEGARKRRRQWVRAEWERAIHSDRRLTRSQLASALWCDESDIPPGSETSKSSGRTAPHRQFMELSVEDMRHLWTSPAIEERREHRIANPTDEDP